VDVAGVSGHSQPAVRVDITRHMGWAQVPQMSVVLRTVGQPSPTVGKGGVWETGREVTEDGVWVAALEVVNATVCEPEWPVAWTALVRGLLVSLSGLGKGWDRGLLTQPR